MYYVQITQDRTAYAITETAGPIDAPDMIAVDSFDISLLGKKHNLDTGLWEEATPPQPS